MIVKIGIWPGLGRILVLVFCVASAPSLAKGGHHDRPAEPRVGPVHQVHATWVNGVVVTPDPVNHGALLPGLAGRLYLFGPELGVMGNGKVVVELFDAAKPNPDAPAKIRWEYNKETLDHLFRKDVMGWGYTLFLPWPQYRPDMARVLLKLRYESDTGVSLFAPETRIALRKDEPASRENTVRESKAPASAPAAGPRLKQGKTDSAHDSLTNSNPKQKVVLDILVAEVDVENNGVLGVEMGMQSPVLFKPSIIPQPGQVGTVRYSVVAPVDKNQRVSPAVVGFQGITNLGSSRGLPTAPDNGGYVANSDTVDVLIRALCVQDRIAVLDRSRIMASDDQPAVVNVRQVLLPENVTITQIGPAPRDVDRRDPNVVLQVSPKTTLDGQVVMRIKSEMFWITNPAVLPARASTKDMAIEHLDTVVSTTGEGETVVLAGAANQKPVLTDNKLPLLGDLPGVGCLFRWRGKSMYTTRLLIFVTPHIFRNREDADKFLGDGNNPGAKAVHSPMLNQLIKHAADRNTLCDSKVLESIARRRNAFIISTGVKMDMMPILQQLIKESTERRTLCDSGVFESNHVQVEDVATFVRYIDNHRDYTSYHLLFALRRDQPRSYKKIPVEVRGMILSSTLKEATDFIDWGDLDLKNYDGYEATEALLEIGRPMVKHLVPLLSNFEEALLSGSEEATESEECQYRRADWACRFIALVLGIPYHFHREPQDRDKEIAALKKLLKHRKW